MLTHNEINEALSTLTSHSLCEVDESTHTLRMIEIRKLVWKIYNEHSEDTTLKKLQEIKELLK